MTQWQFMIEVTNSSEDLIKQKESIYIDDLHSLLKLRYPEISIYDVRDAITRLIRRGKLLLLNNGAIKYDI